MFYNILYAQSSQVLNPLIGLQQSKGAVFGPPIYFSVIPTVDNVYYLVYILDSLGTSFFDCSFQYCFNKSLIYIKI